MIWKEIEDIYNRLQDEKSKFIFRKRLEYNLCHESKEALYAIGVCEEDNEEHSFYTLLKNRNMYLKEQPIVIFGAGRVGASYKNIINYYEVGKVVAYCDNKKELWGTDYRGVQVLSVEETHERYPSALFIVASVYFGMSMKTQLLNLGVKDENIFMYISNDKIFGIQYFDQNIIHSYSDNNLRGGGIY